MYVTKQTKKKEKEKAKLIQSRVVTYVYNMIKKKKVISVHRVANLRPTKEKTV